MIKYVETFGPELQPHPFINREIPPHCQVHLPSSKASCKIARSISEPGADITEGLGVNCPPSRTFFPWGKIPQRLKHRGAIGPVQVERLTRDSIESCEIALPIRLPQCPAGQGYRKSCASGHAAIE